MHMGNMHIVNAAQGGLHLALLAAFAAWQDSCGWSSKPHSSNMTVTAWAPAGCLQQKAQQSVDKNHGPGADSTEYRVQSTEYRV